MYEDKTLVCKECGAEFVFTAGEQEFYAERGFQNEPQRCKACRDARKNAARSPREYFTAVCANCGGEARVQSRKPDLRFSAPCGMLCLSKLQTIGFCVIILHFFRHIGR